MIKFIASDMDGTLFDSQKRLPPDFEYVLSELNKRGIIFAVASGRQYETLRVEFCHIKEKMMIIAENGAIVFNGNERIICETIEKEKAYEIIQKLKEYENFYPTICGVKSAYGEIKNKDILKKDVSIYYKKYEFVDNLADVLEYDDVLKFSILDPKGTAKNGYPTIKSLCGDNVEVSLSGEKWVDIMKKNISKGSAIRKIRDIYGIKKEECVSFGDYMNDYEMMKECAESYAMANAYPELKEICKYECKSNNEHGVTEKIKELLNI
jgi:Cof subfamily protein (haloacid dehalogenase superfamily)